MFTGVQLCLLLIVHWRCSNFFPLFRTQKSQKAIDSVFSSLNLAISAMQIVFLSFFNVYNVQTTFFRTVIH